MRSVAMSPKSPPSFKISLVNPHELTTFYLQPFSSPNPDDLLSQNHRSLCILGGKAALMIYPTISRESPISRTHRTDYTLFQPRHITQLSRCRHPTRDMLRLVSILHNHNIISARINLLQRYHLFKTGSTESVDAKWDQDLSISVAWYTADSP